MAVKMRTKFGQFKRWTVEYKLSALTILSYVWMSESPSFGMKSIPPNYPVVKLATHSETRAQWFSDLFLLHSITKPPKLSGYQVTRMLINITSAMTPAHIILPIAKQQYVSSHRGTTKSINSKSSYDRFCWVTSRIWRRNLPPLVAVTSTVVVM